MMETTTGNVSVSDGTQLYTRTWAPTDPKADLLVVHGLGEHSGRWDHVGSYLAERGFAVTAFDLRGHGNSTGPRCHVDTFDQMVEDLATVADSLGRDRPWVLYGHSLGGLISTLYLTSDHRKPDAAILSAPGLDDDLPAYLRLGAKVLGRLRPELSVANSISGEHLSRDPEVGEAYFSDPLVQTKATYGFGLEGFAAQHRARASLERIDVPTLVVHGAEDRLVPPHASAPFAGVEGIERKLYPGLRHEIHNEPESDQVLSDVADWLDSALS